MSEENNLLEGKLVESFEAKELGDLAAEYSELGLDSILDDGIVKDIPILRTVVSLAKIGFNIRDRIYLKKIIGFLAQVGQTTQEQRDEFVKKYCDDVESFEETVMLILEQANRIEKTILVGKIFRTCILGEISYEDTLNLSNMINNTLWSDIEAIKDKKYDQEIRMRLCNSGLLSLDWMRRAASDSIYVQKVEFAGFATTRNRYTEMLKKILNAD
jgi:hypothetical protein